MRIGYFADGPWSHLALEEISKNQDIEIKFICVRSDSRDEVLPKKALALNVPCLKDPNINSTEFLESLRKFDCDLFVSMSFDQIFKTQILEIPRYGIINCHAGKLPFYRGRNIINWALINDEKEFGITVHYVDQGIDTGDIILQKTFPITDEDDYNSLLQIAYNGCSETLNEALRLLISNKAERIPQNRIHKIGSYCGKRVEGDEIINWNQTSREIFNFIRAICRPGPQATTTYNGSLAKINKCKFIKDAPSYKGSPGQIIGKTTEGWLVKTLDSFIEISEVEAEKKLRVGERFR